MDQDLKDLLASWLGGNLDDARADALLARLRADADFRRAFVAEIRLLGMLKAVQSSEPRWLGLEDEFGWSADKGPTLNLLEENVARRLRKLPSPRLLPWTSATAAAALLLLAGAWLAWFWPESQGPAPALAEEDGPPGVAVIVRANEAVWDTRAGPAPKKGASLPAGRIRLKSGQVTLSFLSGVTTFVEGPADLELISSERVVCHRGQIRNRVPLGAEGFTILAPGVAVVDFGTDLGLNVLADGKSELEVFEGRADVSILNGEGNTLRNAMLFARQPVELDPKLGVIRGVDLTEEHFAAAVEIEAPPLTLDPAYAAAVQQSRPWGYWRFEELKDGISPNEVPGRPALRAEGSLKLDGVAGGNRSVVFGPGDRNQALVMDGAWKTPRGTGYAVEVWVLAEAYTTSSLVSLIARDQLPVENHSFLLELTAQRRTWVHQPCSVRFLERWPPDISGGVNVFSRRRYVPYRWHHLVAQKVGDRLELYLDGQLHGMALVDPLDVTTDYRLLVGRLKQGAQLALQQIRPFVGRIDELAVYDHPLSGDDVRRHYELRRPSTQ